MNRIITSSMLVLLVLTIFACGTAPEATEAPPPAATEVPPTQAPTQPPQPTNTSLPPTETAIPPTPTPAGPPPDPQVIEFTTEDGATLKGTYFPAAINPAPVVVLMHQVNFDEREWKAIAPWLQNRGVSWDAYARGSRLASLSRQGTLPWNDPAWFPAMPDALQVAIFTVTFRDCAGPSGCVGWLGMKWAMDATAALVTASQLEGVDPQLVSTIGTSIGADGAVDSCLRYMEQTGRKCAGAMAVSPGSYLEMNFAATVKKLTDAGILTYCVSGRGDNDSYRTCNSFTEDTDKYVKIIQDNNNHGIAFATPSADPNLLEMMITYLTAIYK